MPSTFLLYLPSEPLKGKIRRLAKKRKQSMSKLLVSLVEQALREEKRL